MMAIDGRFARKASCLAAAFACAGAAVAAPTGFAVSAGSASYVPAALTVTSTSARTHVSWTSFNVAADEVFRFVQPNAQSSVLNHVFNAQSLRLLGALSSNGSVLFMVNGMVSGPDLNLDLAGAIDTSLRLPRIALALRGGSPLAASRPLATLADGRIHVISRDHHAVTTANDAVLLLPGKTIELASASMPHLRVELTAPLAEAINLNRLVGSKGDSGIFAALFRVPAAARQAAEREDDAVLTASAEERSPGNPDIDRFYRYAHWYARMRNETPHDEGGLLKVAAASSSRTVLPAARSRPGVLPQAIEIGAPARFAQEARVALSYSPVAAAVEPAATLEPQPIAAAGDNEPERNRVTLLAPLVPTAEPVATLEPQPIAAAGDNEPERSRVTLLALAPVLPAAEQVAALEPQPILLRQPLEPEDIGSLAANRPVDVPLPLESRFAQAPEQPGDGGEGRYERRPAAAVIVVALAQHSAAPVPREDANVKEVRIERRAPRYFTDYRGAMFFM